eukprot:TRINITY_DN34736_c0_g1_i1.p1 TRINITY_DN34736_c0_g1~~TRINITY_DN34736_c0_g1_i1.p1  ORF type:complete len:131 (+),score=38.17 TRINITY_DN34736_c0_g1_i1:1-393(+)
MGSGGNPNPPPFQRSVRPWWSHQSHQQQQQQDLWGLPQQRLQGPSEQGFGYPYGNELQQYNQQQLQQQPYQQQLVPLEEQAMEAIPRPPVIHSPPPPPPLFLVGPGLMFPPVRGFLVLCRLRVGGVMLNF